MAFNKRTLLRDGENDRAKRQRLEPGSQAAEAFERLVLEQVDSEGKYSLL